VLAVYVWFARIVYRQAVDELRRASRRGRLHDPPEPGGCETSRDLRTRRWAGFWEMGDAYSRFMESDETVYASDVLAHFAAQGYGDFEWLDHLRWIRKPMLVIDGRFDRTCTLARSEEIHREVEGSDLAVIEKAAHMAHVEQPKAYMDAVRRWLIAQGVLPDPSATPD
jgi:pimeloyl-ACP methyl ester carboxylesterase